ncbi:hypothetical protein ACOMHN_019355 [Nucella lapillus]|uniref:Putative piwi-1 n=1 Tax=Nucella lapillus TaxID=51631 RepID=A0A2S1PRX7_NUCLP|nr:putative piwi-1 [Nucella lapillus]
MDEGQRRRGRGGRGGRGQKQREQQAEVPRPGQGDRGAQAPQPQPAPQPPQLQGAWAVPRHQAPPPQQAPQAQPPPQQAPMGAARPQAGRGYAPPQGAWGPRPQAATVPVPEPPAPQAAEAPQASAWGPRPQAARGRVAQQGAWGGAPPQPGEPAQQPQQAAWGPTPQGSTPGQPGEPEPAPLAAGRAVRRGTSRTQEARAGGDAQVEELAAQVEGASLQAAAQAAQGAQGAGEGRVMERMRYNPYDDVQFVEPGSEKIGSDGNTVNLRGNYFKLNVPLDYRLYQYHVDFTPVVDGKLMKRALLFNHSEVIGNVRAYDGTALYLPRKLESDLELHSNRRSDNANVKITIKFSCELFSINPATIQFFNIIWRKVMGMMNLRQIQRQYFDVENRIAVGNYPLEVLSGFQTSILRYEEDVLLDIDVAHKILRKDTVLDYMNNCRMNRNMLDKELPGKIVMTRYNNKTYRVEDISWEGKVTDTFERGTMMISYIQYYQTQYNVQILNRNQPLLVTNGKSRDKHGTVTPCFIYLVPELCLLTGFSEESRTDFRLRKDLDVHTKLDPDSRARKLKGFLTSIHNKEEAVKELKAWNMRFEPNLVQIQGRELPQQDVFMRSRGQNIPLEFEKNKVEWSRAMQSRQMLLTINLKNWILVYMRRSEQNARSLAQSLREVAGKMGMNIENPSTLVLDNDRLEAILRGLNDNVKVNHTQMVVCILPNNRKDRYDGIKKFCCLQRPVPSQMVLDKTLSKPRGLMSVATKIAIQMNCKLGGVVWNMHIPLKGSMIVGIDCYHDSSQKKGTVGGVVASTSADFTRYKSTVTFQTRHVELINQLESCLNVCREAYFKERQAYPSSIVVFRDGVGDGQLQTLRDHEIPQIKTAMRNIPMVFYVVKKRTNARFFREAHGGDQSGGRGGSYGRGARGGSAGQGGVQLQNPLPGTVVDKVVTKPNWWDFFLVAQTVREGTISPTHYNVLLNELNLKANTCQMLAYRMTHMYYNWQGTIRVPAPCMYAHKLAFLVGQSLHRAPSGPLTNHLYYL